MGRYFTLEEAQELLPQVEKEIRQALRLKTEHEQADAELQTIHHRVMMMGGMMIERGRFLSQRARRDATAQRLKETIEVIHNYGCQVKDLEIGLIDFPTLFRGQEVCLCWKLGEPRIEFWHGLEEGFRGRKSIDEEFLENHRGDQPQ